MSKANVPGLGDAAPPFQLVSDGGAVVSLEHLHRGGPALLVFYRGWW